MYVFIKGTYKISSRSFYIILCLLIPFVLATLFIENSHRLKRYRTLDEKVKKQKKSLIINDHKRF